MIAVKEYITIDKDILFGKPVFKDTRVPVETLIDHLEKGITLDEFLEDFPTVNREQALAMLEIKKLNNQSHSATAARRWEKANVSLKNHLNYLANKKSRYPITLIDLLYISNFKGGNGTINEDETQLNEKLKVYSDHFKKIEESFKSRALGSLNIDELDKLIKNIDCVMVLTSTQNRIDGFNVSRLSALLHSYFPVLIPIIDRRTLNTSDF